MRKPRVHLDGELAIGDTVALPSATGHHLVRVLRHRDGDEIIAFNGQAGDWHGRLRIAGKREVRVEIDAFQPAQRESGLDLRLVQGISRGQRMDYTLEKSVELGVAAITPVTMKRTQAPPTADRLARKHRHWRGVVASAAAQSGRTRLPELAAATGFDQWLAQAEPRDHPHLLLDPGATRGLASLAGSRCITLLAGPEGGFAPAEREAALAAGCLGVTLGPRILRTETAAVAALAALQVLYGDLGGAGDY